METIRSLRSVRVLLLLLLTITGAVVAWVVLTGPAPDARGSPPAAPPKVEIRGDIRNFTVVDEDQDEIDPEACATTILKIIEEKGPVAAVIRPLITDGVTGSDVFRVQTIVEVIQACNVDDEIRDPNLERELDVDIEVFSIICDKAVDLRTEARCEAKRVAQEDNSDISENLSGG